MQPSLRNIAAPLLALLFSVSLLNGLGAEAPIPYPTGAHSQRVRKFFTSAEGLPADQIQAVAALRDGSVIAVTSNSLAQLQENRWNVVRGPTGATALFAPTDGPIAFAGATNGIW